MKRTLMTHCLSGGGTHNIGYDALRWENILHGDCVHDMVGIMNCLYCLTRLRDICLSSTQIHTPASICLRYLRTEAKSTSMPWWIRHRFCIESDFVCMFWLFFTYDAYVLFADTGIFCIFVQYSGPSALRHFAVAAVCKKWRASEDVLDSSDRAQKISRGAACLLLTLQRQTASKEYVQNMQ